MNWASNDDDNDARPTTNLSTRPLQLQDSLSSTASRPSSSASRALTPAQQYRETLRAMTPAEHVLRRLAWRWEKDIDTWRAGTVKIQRLQRGIASRSFSDVLKAQKQAMYSVVKITLKAGGDVTMGKADDAIFSLSRALHVDPGAKLAYLVRGRAYFVQGMYNEAMNDFSSVVMSGTAEESRDDVLRMRIALGDEYHTALTTFDRLKLFSVGTLVDSFHDPQIRAANDMIKVAGFANKGRLNMVQKFYQNAIEDFTEVIESRGLDDGDCDFASMYVTEPRRPVTSPFTPSLTLTPPPGTSSGDWRTARATSGTPLSRTSPSTSI